MTDVAFAELLADAILATGIERYAWLVSAANTLPPPNSREDWREFIISGKWQVISGKSGEDLPPSSLATDHLPLATGDYLAGLPPLGPGPCGGCPGGGG